MTTIATDGKSMAGDGLAVCRSTIVEHSIQKVIRLPDGTLVGTAGGRHDGLAFKAWLAGGNRPKIREAFEALVLRLDGTCTYHCEKDLDGLPTELPATIGSGMDYALGALDAGATPEEAVRIACRRDMGTGGIVTSLDLVGQATG